MGFPLSGGARRSDTWLALSHFHHHPYDRDGLCQIKPMAFRPFRWARRSDTRLALSHFHHHKAGHGPQKHRLGAPPGVKIKPNI